MSIFQFNHSQICCCLLLLSIFSFPLLCLHHKMLLTLTVTAGMGGNELPACSQMAWKLRIYHNRITDLQGHSAFLKLNISAGMSHVTPLSDTPSATACTRADKTFYYLHRWHGLESQLSEFQSIELVTLGTRREERQSGQVIIIVVRLGTTKLKRGFGTQFLKVY